MSDDQAPDFGERADVKEAAKTLRMREAGKRLALRTLMGSPEGRDWVWDVLTFCGVYQNAFNPESHKMAFNTGQQNVGQRILAELVEVAPELYLKMQTERSSRDAQVLVPDAALESPGRSGGGGSS